MEHRIRTPSAFMSAALPSPALLDQLSRRSTPYRDPLSRIPWDRLDRGRWWLPESAVSLCGTARFVELPEAQRVTLSQFEFVHLLQAGLWLEGIFLERLGRWVRRESKDVAQHIYALHEIREEAGHSLMFLTLIAASGLKAPPSPFPGLRLANLAGRYLPFQHCAFWLAAFIGEALPDRVNRFIREHGADLCPTVEEMARIHIVEEARHIAHARDRLDRLLPRLPRWQAPLVRALTGRLLRSFVDTLFYPGAAFYEAAGLTPGGSWRRAARENLERRRFVESMVRPVLRTLEGQGWRLAWP
jgi:P-aminobenzoate N-oxygenase AurF